MRLVPRRILRSDCLSSRPDSGATKAKEVVAEVGDAEVTERRTAAPRTEVPASAAKHTGRASVGIIPSTAILRCAVVILVPFHLQIVTKNNVYMYATDFFICSPNRKTHQVIN